MGTITRRVIRSLTAIALLGSAAVAAAPATHAAGPTLILVAESIVNHSGGWEVEGANFFNYQSVTLRAYGIANGQKALLATTQVLSFLNASHYFEWYFTRQDPCMDRSAYPLVEVDAYGWPTPVVRSAGAVASLIQPPTPYMPLITSATANLGCGVVIR